MFHIAVVLSGDGKHRYTSEWWREGDKDKVCDRVSFDTTSDAEAWAEEQINERFGGKHIN